MKKGMIVFGLLIITLGLFAFCHPKWKAMECDTSASSGGRNLRTDSPAPATYTYFSPIVQLGITKPEPYTLSFELEKSERAGYRMVTTMDLHAGSYYISPHATRDFKGKFSIRLDENNELQLGKDFTETPRSKEIYDPHPFTDGLVNWVDVDTRYEYPLTVSSAEDFEVKGMIRFTIEPRCTLEEIPFVIMQRSGLLSIQPWGC